MRYTRFSRMPFVASMTCLQFFFAMSTLAQPVAPKTSLVEGKSYAVYAFGDSLPSFRPIKSVFASQAKSATVTLPDTLGTLYVCMGKDKSGEWTYRLLHRLYGTGGWDFYQLAGAPDAFGDIQGFSSLRPLAGRPIPFPVEVRIQREKGLLLFRWQLSPEIVGVPGGVPTPTSVSLDLGKPIFDFTVTDLSGNEVRSSSLKGKVSVVNWWHTRCVPCIEEMKGFNSLARKYRGQVEFLAIAIDTIRNVQKFLATREFLFRQTVAGDSMWEYIGNSVPRTVVLNEQGVVTFYLAGGSEDSYQQVEKAIELAIKDKK